MGNKILEDIQANHKRLDSCKLHNFNKDLEPERTLTKHWMC